MFDPVVRSGWDSVLLGVPFVAMLFCGFFRLDEVFAAKGQAKSTDRERRPFSGLDADGEPIVCDPDGRRSCGATIQR